MAVNASTIRADIYKEFISVLGNLSTTSAYVSDSDPSDEADLPQVVVRPVRLSRQREGFNTSSASYRREGSIDIDVYASTVQEVTELIDDIEDTVFNNLSSLSVQNVSFGEGDVGPLELSGSFVQITTLPVDFTIKR